MTKRARYSGPISPKGRARLAGVPPSVRLEGPCPAGRGFRLSWGISSPRFAPSMGFGGGFYPFLVNFSCAFTVPFLCQKCYFSLLTVTDQGNEKTALSSHFWLYSAVSGMVSRRGFEPRKNGLTMRKKRHTVLLLCFFGEKCVQLCRRACKAALPDMGIDFLRGCKVCMPHKFHG